MVENLTVADFFCGAGGFSEGFRQAGFKIIFALDNWDIARKTHEFNHPNCEHPNINILEISPEEVDNIVKDTHIIIGSPPCVSFSYSNCAGKADKTHGKELIKKYFQIIAIKKYRPNSILKYWIMENVPNSRKFIDEKYTFKDLGLTNEILDQLRIKKKEEEIALKLDVSKNNIYNSVDFGVPQRRKRFFCGEFPRPKKQTPDKSQWTTLGEVIRYLNNNIPPDLKTNPKVVDPNFGFSIPDENLTDHYYDTTIHRFEWEQAKRRKCNARYYGKMSFPENESMPSRTIMATRSTLTRESLIIGTGKTNIYRALTVREAATIMSFPITYQFLANSESSKYVLVGNAVCPKLAYEFAKAILEKEGFEYEQNFQVISNKSKIDINLRNSKNNLKLPRNKHNFANFAEIIPELKQNSFRVELDNNFPREGTRKLKWSVSIHHATGIENMKVARPTKKNIWEIFNQLENKDEINLFIKEIELVFKKKIPNKEIFQIQNCLINPRKEFFTPCESLDMVKTIVDKYFPKELYENTHLSNKMNGNKKVYIEFDNGNIPNDEIPIRIIAGLYALIYVVELTEKGYSRGPA